MRTLGFAVLGLFIGLIAGLLLTEAIARPIVGGDGDISTGLAIFLGMLMPAIGAVGAVVGAQIGSKSKDDVGD